MLFFCQVNGISDAESALELSESWYLCTMEIFQGILGHFEKQIGVPRSF
jgi:hypothetical protein